MQDTRLSSSPSLRPFSCWQMVDICHDRPIGVSRAATHTPRPLSLGRDQWARARVGVRESQAGLHRAPKGSAVIVDPTSPWQRLLHFQRRNRHDPLRAKTLTAIFRIRCRGRYRSALYKLHHRQPTWHPSQRKLPRHATTPAWFSGECLFVAITPERSSGKSRWTIHVGRWCSRKTRSRVWNLQIGRRPRASDRRPAVK